MKQVNIDEDECIGCETCVELCPDVFAFNADSNKAIVITSEGGDENCIEEAVTSYPVTCITYEEA